MSLDKGIEHGKEHRKPYYSGSKRFDYSCRNHGSCGWCCDTRTYNDRKNRAAAKEEIEMYLGEEEWWDLADWGILE